MTEEKVTEEKKEEVQDPAAVLAELRRAQDDLKSVRAELKEANKARQVAEQNLADNSPDEWRNKALSAETRLALNAQGIKDVDRLMKYVGTDGLDFDDDGKVTGLDERLKTLKTDLPEIFDPKRRVGGKGDIFANDSVDTKQSSTEAQVARIFAH